MKTLCLLGRAVVLIAHFGGASAAEVIVNREPLDVASKQRLEQMYRVEVRPGRYWYDRMSGAWGVEGGPMLGQIAPGLSLGGPLRQDASSGRTGVVVNGRELHPQDVQALQRCVPVVQPGRYWIAANGVGGRDGEPPTFDLAALCAAAQRSREPLQCDGSGSCGSTPRVGVTGVIIEPGGTGGSVTYNGKFIMTPN
jgi:hypothetical protein